MAIRLSGLSSGLDTESIVAELVKAKSTKKEKLEKELARSKGMLSNEKFISKAPAAKVEEEKAKLEKYQQMMDDVLARLAQMK